MVYQHTTRSKFQDASLLITRLVLAAIFLYAGYGKWAFLSSGTVELPQVMVILTTFLMIVEPLGALGLIFGYLTRWASAGLSLIMFGSLFFLRLSMGTAFFTMPQATGLDYNVLILAGCLMLAGFGAGKWSLDALRSR